MTTDPSDPQDLKALWRNQATEPTPMTLADIHARSFQTRIRWRNGREYAAIAVAIPLLIWRAVHAPLLTGQIGFALTAAGVMVVAWQLHRRASAQPVPVGSAASSLAFHRAQLVRQRDFLKRIWLWYILPITPGMALVLVGRLAIDPSHLVRQALALAFAVAGFSGIVALNRWGARRMQRQIDELDRLGRE
jgi:hypothetical protein